jgi:hypothetical protein
MLLLPASRSLTAAVKFQVAHRRRSTTQAAAAGFEKHHAGAGRPKAVGSSVQPDLLLVRDRALSLAAPTR